MMFSFGIVTQDSQAATGVINSIYKNDIHPDLFEVIVVGGENNYQNMPKVRHVPFDETIKDGWITKKKNLITEKATYDNIVFMHDYVHLCDGWFDGFKRFGDDWDICMTVMWNLNDTRFRDWVLWDHPELCYVNGKHGCVLAPYDYSDTKHHYISGAYWVAKKEVMKQEPLDENLVWGQSEDVEWSKRVREKYRYKMNRISAVKITKYKNYTAGIVVPHVDGDHPYRPVIISN